MGTGLTPFLFVYKLIQHPRPRFHSPSYCHLSTSHGRAFSASCPVHWSTTPSLTDAATYPTIATCPPSSCPCAAMPRDLDIDRVQDMKGSTQQYAHHVLIRTGRDWWKNKIEDEGMEGVTGGPNFAKSLQQLVGKGGKFYNVGTNGLASFATRTKSAT